jgi:hypothetical protein
VIVSKPLATRLARRLRAELLNARRGFALIGWSRPTGPPRRPGAVVRADAPARASGDEGPGEGRQSQRGEGAR